MLFQNWHNLLPLVCAVKEYLSLFVLYVCTYLSIKTSFHVCICVGSNSLLYLCFQDKNMCGQLGVQQKIYIPVTHEHKYLS